MMKKLFVILAAIGLAVAYSSCGTTSDDRGSNQHSGGHKHYNPIR